MKVRDKAAPEKRVQAAIADFETAVKATLASGRLDQPTVGYQLAIVRGRYTLGASAAECLEPAAQIIDNFCDWVERLNGVLEWYMVAQLYNEFVGAAVLTGKQKQVFSAFAKAKWKTPPPALEEFCMGALPHAFGASKTAAAQPPKPPTWLPPMLPMLDALNKRDTDQFPSALVTFLTKSYGPLADKQAKESLASHWPLYTGKWSLLSAAACKFMGTVPEIPRKAEQYFPRELI